MGQEEHQVYKKEPEGSYLDHSVIPEGTGRGLAMDFLGVIADTGSKNTLRAVLMDGCGVNLGWKIGMFVTIERELGFQFPSPACYMLMSWNLGSTSGKKMEDLELLARRILVVL